MGTEQKRMFLAVILSGIVLFAWQAWFAPPPQVAKPDINQKTVLQDKEQEVTRSSTEQEAKDINEVEDISNSNIKSDIKEFELSNGKQTVIITNNLVIKKIVDPENKFDFGSITGSENPFKISVDIQRAFFQFLDKIVKLKQVIAFKDGMFHKFCYFRNILFDFGVSKDRFFLFL